MTKPTAEECITLIRRMERRFSSGNPSVWQALETREKHYYQTVEADPPMLEGYESHAFQSSILRDTWMKYRSRLVENPFLPQCSAPRPSATMDKVAADCELYLQTLVDDARALTGDDIQGMLADGMGIYNYGVLHCYLSDDEMNAASAKLDYEETDDNESD